MLTNEELDSLSIGGLGFCGPESFERLIAQAKEANKLREQLVTARRDALESAASHFESTHRELWTPQVADELRALKEKA